MKRTILSACIAMLLLPESARSVTAKVCDSDSVPSAAAVSDPATGDCEPAAPYTLKIIKSGEANPRSTNTTAEGRQDNRRVDVTVARPVTVDAVAGRSVELAQGGTVWVTRDPATLDRTLSIETGKSATIEGGELVAPVKFKLRSNYSAFIDRWEIHIFAAGSEYGEKPLVVLPGSDLGLQRTVDWTAESVEGLELAHGQSFEYALRVYDEKGHYDQTHKSTLKLLEVDREELQRDVQLLSLDDPEHEPSETLDLARQGIPVNGAKVRIHGRDIDTQDELSINGEQIELTNDRDFVVEYLLPHGKHDFEIKSKDGDDESFSKSLQVDLDTHYFFMVALADLTVGKNKVRGSVEPLSVDEHHYGGDIFVDGRLAFYLKGKVKGKYLVTAQMDTGTEDVSKLFDDFHRKDPDSVFRRIDPDQYYLVYGDDSALYDDTDSQGKIYIRAEWDKSHVLWGNFNTAISGSELAPFNRSLYGAQLVHRSISNTALGENKTQVTAFASQAQTAFRHNEFLGTGGSLYYLKDKDIVRGSEKVSVEVRQNGSERVVEKINLVAGRDYEIDEFQGRLILTRALISVSQQAGPSIIRDEPLDTENTWLVVDYEYTADEFDAGQVTSGVRAKGWLSDHLAIGGTWAHENRNENAYDIKGVDITLKKSDNTYLRAEIARSQSSQTSGSFISNDGGLNFDAFNSNANTAEGIPTSGQAISLEGRLSANDFSSQSKAISVGSWIKQRGAGYSVANVDTGSDTIDAGIEVLAEFNPRLQASARATLFERKTLSRDAVVAAQLDYAATERLDTSMEVRHVSEESLSTNEKALAALAAGKIAYDFTGNINLYGIAQGTLTRSGSYEPNNLVTLGSSVELNEKFQFNTELSKGDRGTGALLGAEWLVSDSYSLYSNITSLYEGGHNANQAVTLGQRKSLSQKLKVYSEHQFTHEDSRQGVSHTIGLDHTLNRYTAINLSLQSARLEDQNGGTTDRDAVSMGVDFKRNKIKAGSRFEYRRDAAPLVQTEQWVLTNRLEYQRSPSFRWQGKLNASITNDRIESIEDARFVEAGLGFAFRPVFHDRLNLLGRLTWLYDLPPASQSDEPDERALIASLEGIYDFSRHFSFGAKVARRAAELRLLRNNGDWIGNDATLGGFRLHYRVPFGVDAMLGYHWLLSEQSNSLRRGALVSVGTSVGDHLKFSIGYNFSNFDDDLANDSYDVRGWFFNLAGTF